MVRQLEVTASSPALPPNIFTSLQTDYALQAESHRLPPLLVLVHRVEVYNLDVAIDVNPKLIWLHVAMHELSAVEESQQLRHSTQAVRRCCKGRNVAQCDLSFKRVRGAAVERRL
jgi:hypothetical protein